jgi:hypothetical protein
MRAVLRSAGEQIELVCPDGHLARVLEEGLAGHLCPATDSRPDVRVTVQDAAAPFDTAGWDVLTRDAWRRPGQVIVRNACSSGLDLLVRAELPTLDIVARWHPPVTGRAAAAVLRARSRLLIRAVLVQYPALWWSQQRGRVPLHASVCTLSAGGPTVLIAGPGGVGKSTLVNAELARGGRATCDNLCVSDGHTAWGLLEPRRVPADSADAGSGTGASSGTGATSGTGGDTGASSGTGAGRATGGRGRRMPHGRREAPWLNRVDEQVPDVLLVLRRGSSPEPTVTPCPPADVARSLTAGTYMAGELRRYWPFAATLALGTGLGEIHPPVERIASKLTARLPCREVILGHPGMPLGDLLPAGTGAEVVS